jgi:hypothetical protein
MVTTYMTTIRHCMCLTALRLKSELKPNDQYLELITRSVHDLKPYSSLHNGRGRLWRQLEVTRLEVKTHVMT